MYKPIKINRIIIRVVLFWLMTQFLSSIVLATEEYTSVYVDGIAPITIDGDLSDWEWFESEWWSLDFVYTSSKSGMPESDDDLSAMFTCFCDSLYLYVAVKVVDDTLCWGHEVFEQGFMDDSVEIYFDGDLAELTYDGYDENDGYIRITKDKKGKVFFEGIPMIRNLDRNIYPNHVFHEQYPYIWDALGVKGSIKTTSNGYQVEISIPNKILGWNELENNKFAGFNIIVNDDDDKYNRESKIGWVVDINNTTWLNTQLLEKVCFSNKMQIVATETVRMPPVENMKTTNEELISILTLLPTLNYKDAVTLLSDHSNELWAHYMLCIFQYFAQDYRNSLQTIEAFLPRCNDGSIVLWMKHRQAHSYKELSDAQNSYYANAINIWQELINVSVVDSSNVGFQALIFEFMGNTYISMKDNDAACRAFERAVEYTSNTDYSQLFILLQQLEQCRDYEFAYRKYEEIVLYSQDETSRAKAQLGIARIMYNIGFFRQARDIALEIIDANKDYSVKLGATMILESLDGDLVNKGL